jgi:hypothetical protein
MFYDETWAWDGMTWAQVSPSVRPPARIMSEMVYDPENGCTVLFGGSNAAGVCLDETWLFDGATWQRRTPAHSPQPRAKFGMAYDGVLKKVVLFGGVNYNTGQFLNDTWAWDGQDWAPLSPSAVPPVRFGHKMAFAPFASCLVMFGGYSGVYYGDTWLLKSSNASPVAQCKDIAIELDADCSAYIEAGDVDAGSSDPEGGALTLSLDFSGPFHKGDERVVTLTVTDPQGASDTCQALVTAVDKTPPVPALASLPTLQGQCSVKIETPPTAWDGCDGQIAGLTVDPLEYTSEGTYTVHWTYTDASGNVATQTQTVVVADTTPPVAALSDPVCVLLGPGKGNYFNRLIVSAADNCGSAADVQILKVEIFNQGGKLVNGQGVYDIQGSEIWINPNARGWSIRVTIAARDAWGNTAQTVISKPLIKC